MRSLRAQVSNASRETAPGAVDESRDRVAGIKGRGDPGGEAVIGDVVEAGAQSPIAFEQMKPLFDLQIQSVVRW